MGYCLNSGCSLLLAGVWLLLAVTARSLWYSDGVACLVTVDLLVTVCVCGLGLLVLMLVMICCFGFGVAV